MRGPQQVSTGANVEIAVLGPVEVRLAGRPVPIERLQRRLLLAVLAASPNTVVSTERIIDALWGDSRLPANPRNQVQVHIRALRRALHDDVCQTIETCAQGYQLNAPPASVDLLRFSQTVDAAAEAVEAGRLVEASTGLQSGLGLWRGRAFEGMDCRFTQDQAAPLEEQRLRALHLRLSVDLTLGRYAELVCELAGLVSGNPFDDGLRWKLMVVLHAVGRTTEAAQIYHDGRQVLEEAGICPGQRLRAAHEAILNGRSAESITAQLAGLVPPSMRAHTPSVVLPPPLQLPPDIADFTGRAPELDQLLLAVSTVNNLASTAPAILAIDGMAGIGKTALAVHAAHLLIDEYPDAQLFIDLRAHTVGQQPRDPCAVLGILLRALGVPARDIPEEPDQRAATWRTALAGRRAVILLDNVADTTQIQPLLPATSGCVILITSRRRLVELDATCLLSLNILSADEARVLFRRIVGERRAQDDNDAIDEVLELCGHLPLAVRIAGARLRHRPAWSVADLAVRLRDMQTRLSELRLGTHSVATAFALSYQQLDAEHRRLFRLLALHPGPDIGREAAAAMTNHPTREAERILENLLDVHLLQQTAHNRYSFHSLLRYYATECTTAEDTEQERALAVRQMFDWYMHAANAADRVILPRRRHIELNGMTAPAQPCQFSTDQEALAWCESERASLIAVVRKAAEVGHPVISWKLAASLWGFFYIRKHWPEQIAVNRLALAAAREAHDPYGEALALHSLGVTYMELLRQEQAIPCLKQALAIRLVIGDHYGQAQTLNSLGSMHRDMGDTEQALAYMRDGLAACRAIDNRYGEASCLNNIGAVHWDLRDVAKAIEYYQQAQTIWHELDDRLGESFAVHNLGEAYADLQRFEEALRYLGYALANRREVGSRWGEGQTLHVIGTTQQLMGKLDGARRSWAEALAIFEELGDPHAREVRGRLALLS